MIRKSEMTKIRYSSDSFREEGKREEAKKYLKIHVGLLWVGRKNKGLKVKVLEEKFKNISPCGKHRFQT